jgi:hypothetical protein
MSLGPNTLRIRKCWTSTPTTNSTGIETKSDSEKEGDVHPDHHEFALGEIDDLDHAEDQRHANADERVNAADEQAVDYGLGHCLHHLN